MGEDKTISFVAVPECRTALQTWPNRLLAGTGRSDTTSGERGDRSTTMGALVLFGSADIYGATKERLFARYPDARHAVLENAGYIAWLQGPDEVRGELCAFFAC